MCGYANGIIIIFLVALSACSKPDSNYENSLDTNLKYTGIGERIVLPDSVLLFDNLDELEYVISHSFFPKGKKILTLINVSCPTCLNDFSLWTKRAPEFTRRGVSLIFVCESKDDFQFFTYLCKTQLIHLPDAIFILDRGEEFRKLNDFLISIELFESALVSEDNIVLKTGNPVKDNDILFKYLYIVE
jgi:hypothetical protein